MQQTADEICVGNTTGQESEGLSITFWTALVLFSYLEKSGLLIEHTQYYA